jgi:hypothetical protein
VRVLITSLVSWPLTGPVTYVRDLALGLKRRGWSPALFSAATGPVGDQLRAAGIPVVSRLEALPWRPVVIHGHHTLPLSVALARWPLVPAINLCHDPQSIHDRPVLHPAVVRYLAVSEVCRQRQIRDGVPPHRAELLFNFVDVDRCPPRAPLPRRPTRALVFSNYASEATHLPAVREACRRAGLTLDVIGLGVGRPVERPESMLGDFDLVFAKAKAALEAMAVGTAVILCDFAGAGPLVTTGAFDRLRKHNFGQAVLTSGLTIDAVLNEIARYDAADAALVSERVRAEASLEAALIRLEHIYQDCVTRHRPPGRVAWPARVRQARDRVALECFWRYHALAPHSRARLRDLGVTRVARTGLLGADRDRRRQNRD